MSEHYFTEQPTSELIKREIKFKHKGHLVVLQTASGTFSPSKLDNGTKALLKYMQLPEKGTVLDLGCGNGPVGIIAGLTTACKVVLTDVNKRALMMARKNARKYGLDFKIVHSNLFDKVEGKFDVILCNPPMAAGKKVVFAMIEGAPAHLTEGGSMQLVARGSKGGKSIKEHMQKIFGNCEIIGRNSGFHVYKSLLLKQ